MYFSAYDIMNQPEYSMILAALDNNYGVFHFDIGTEDGVPYAELGIAAPCAVSLYMYSVSKPENIWNSVSFNKPELVEGISTDAICEYCNTNLFPIITKDITEPEEISRDMILGIEEDVDKDGRAIVRFDINDSNNDTLNVNTTDLHELIIRCSYDPAQYKELTFDNPGIKEWTTRHYAGLYLTHWMTMQMRLVVSMNRIE